MNFSFEPIGIVHTCFKEKFGIPRQPGLIPEAEGRLEILPPYNRPEAFIEIEGYSHLWITFVFHAALRESWSPTVRPPRLGGNRRVGVFASRSPFRPNPIGLSAVELRSMELTPKKITLVLGGVDLLDGTPVLDIKPYIPYADAIPDALGGFASSTPRMPVDVTYTSAADIFLDHLQQEQSAHLRRLIQQIMDHDPRPAYLQGSDSQAEFGMRLYDFNIRWQVESDKVVINAIEPVIPGAPE